jgi:DNA-binding SARP family transcriptional activator
MTQDMEWTTPSSLSTSVQFNVLGLVTVVDGSESLNIGGPKQRTVLAMLIANHGRPVSNEVIAAAVYGEDASPRNRRNVQTYVSTLRSIVGDVIVRQGSGWFLDVEPSQIDALAFEDLCERARKNPDAAGRILREALGLWRGHPYHDIESHGRLAAHAARIDADLESGRHADLIGEIEGLIAEHPYSERFRAQHMLAPYRAGRQREAMRSFEDMRSLLVEELGVDPTPELQGLEQRILEQDSSLDVSPRRQIQRRAILVADPGDPIELARLPAPERQELLANTAAALNAAAADWRAFSFLPALLHMPSSAISPRPPRRPNASYRTRSTPLCAWPSTSGTWRCPKTV